MKRLVLIDDDTRFTGVLKRRFEAQGNFEVSTFACASAALQAPAEHCFGVLLDMMLETEVGLDFVGRLNSHFQPQHLIILTGYASIATTVAAIKDGATDYLAKPVGFEELLARLGGQVARPEHTFKPMTPAQVEWEHIQRVLASYEGNVTATAKALGMHRRSLQRKLQKFSPR